MSLQEGRDKDESSRTGKLKIVGLPNQGVSVDVGVSL